MKSFGSGRAILANSPSVASANLVLVMICVGLVSSISAMMWIGPRVMMTMGEDIPALRVFSKRSVSGAPAYAILFQLAVANLLLFTRSFEAVLDFIQFALLFCSFFTVAGVIKLRITNPELPRPYRTWGYPFTPLVFLLVTAFMPRLVVADRLEELDLFPFAFRRRAILLQHLANGFA